MTQQKFDKACMREKRALAELYPDVPKKRRAALAVIIVKARMDDRLRLKWEQSQALIPASGPKISTSGPVT